MPYVKTEFAVPGSRLIFAKIGEEKAKYYRVWRKKVLYLGAKLEVCEQDYIPVQVMGIQELPDKQFLFTLERI